MGPAAAAEPSSILKKILRTVFLQFIIIRHIWWQVLLATLYTFAVVTLFKFYGEELSIMNWNDSLIPVLGLVPGLLLVFRTNTSYDRYYEARRLWDLMTRNIRLLTKWIWIIVRVDNVHDMLEKRCAINLCLAFAIASKHYLREEYSYEYPDLKGLVSHLPKMYPEPKSAASEENKAAQFKRKSMRHRHRRQCLSPPTNIPLEISYYIGVYLFNVKRKEIWDPAISGMFFNTANTLNECLTGFERIKRTPIPLAYTIHLHHVIWLYILSLPYQLVASLGWWTIPGVSLAAFTCSGILEIGAEIEDPFGYDYNDLPLDDLCQSLGIEINAMLGNELPKKEDLYLSTHNYPLPDCHLNTVEMAALSVEQVQGLLNVVAAAQMPDSPRPKIRTDLKITFDSNVSLDSSST